MGQDTSKPLPDAMKHVFKSDSPIRLSPETLAGLQNSPESDSTRAKDLELLIQSRVQKELARLEAEQDKALRATEERISAAEAPKGGPDNDRQNDLGRASVQREIDALQKKLGKRKRREGVVQDVAVERAKEEVVGCLRLNDRRPLDCWKEVETFKREVGRLEAAFLGKVLE